MLNPLRDFASASKEINSDLSPNNLGQARASLDPLLEAVGNFVAGRSAFIRWIYWLNFIFNRRFSAHRDPIRSEYVGAVDP